MYCGNGPVSGARSCPISDVFHRGSLWIGDDALRRALYTQIDTAIVSDNWVFVTMAQDGLANLKEGLEEAFADLGIRFQLKQVSFE